MKKAENQIVHKTTFIKLFITSYVFIPVVETLFIAVYVSESYLPLALCWAIGSLVLNLSYKTTLSLASYYLFFSLLLLYRSDGFSANRFAIWFYLFLGLGVVFYFLEKFGFRSKNKELMTPFSALRSIWKYILFSSKYLFVLFILFIAIGIYIELLNQAKYFYWFFAYDKFRRYVEYTAVYEIAYLAVLVFIFYKTARLQINRRLFLLIFLGLFFLGNSLIFKLTTRSITLNGDEPIISEIVERDDLFYVFGHNFRRWPNDYSKVFIDDQTQDIVYWNSDLIVLKASKKKVDSEEIWITNALKLTSRKFKLERLNE